MVSLVKKIFDNYRIKKEGGYQVSRHARKLAKANNVEIGMYTYGGCFQSSFNTGGKVTIGRYCSFGPDVRYFGANHPMNCVTMTPYFYNQEWASTVGNVEVKDITRSELLIGHDCWIGYGAIITSACHKIGNGAVVGAGAVVTHDVEPYSIVAGNPARVIRRRFDEKTIEALEKSMWFELEPADLMRWYEYKENPYLFAKKVLCDKEKYRNKDC